VSQLSLLPSTSQDILVKIAAQRKNRASRKRPALDDLQIMVTNEASTGDRMKQTQLTPDSGKKRRIVSQTLTGRQEERAISTVPQARSQPVSSSEGQLAEVDVIGTESMTEDDSLAPHKSQQDFKILKTTTKLKSVGSRLSNLVPATPYNMAEIEQHRSTWCMTLARYKNELSGNISRINHLEEKVDRQEMELQSIRETRKKTDEQGKRTSEYLAMTKRALYDAEHRSHG
jgi:hypothetical protein